MYNFDDPLRPKCLLLPAGVGKGFVEEVEKAIETLKTELPKAFESKDYEEEVRLLLKSLIGTVPPASKGTNLTLTLSHAPFGEGIPSRTGKRKWNLQNLPSTLTGFYQPLLGIPSLGSLTGTWLALKAFYKR